MRSILAVSLCFLFTFSIQAQTTQIKEKTQEVTKLTLAKEDSEGNIVEDIEVLDVKDIPLYCYIDLSSDNSTAVKMKVIAVKAKRLRKNAAIVTVNYKTKQGDNSVKFTARPGKIWAEGDYRVDVYLNDRLAKSKEFKVEKLNDNQTQK